ncbi:hypothetical protein [Lacticaseibacillus sharpeae]|uniref:hypothetical protein n=1 Tax=Lacticaseibacillus sharpeae TaxID=1626 RepID=UPI0006CF8BB7|nr:hypothetical protein [Lacticaseibacillus sharpeae]
MVFGASFADNAFVKGFTAVFNSRYFDGFLFVVAAAFIVWAVWTKKWKKFMPTFGRRNKRRR